MKKILSLIIIASLLLSFAACGTKEPEQGAETSESKTETSIEKTPAEETKPQEEKQPDIKTQEKTSEEAIEIEPKQEETTEEVCPEATDYGAETLAAYLNAVAELDIYLQGTGVPGSKQSRPDITSSDYTFTENCKMIDGISCFEWKYNKNTFYGPLYIWVDENSRNIAYTGFSTDKPLKVWDKHFLITSQTLTAEMFPMMDPYTPTSLDEEQKAVIAAMHEQFPQILEYCNKKFSNIVSRFTGYDYFCMKKDDGSYYGYTFSWGGTSAGYVFEFNAIKNDSGEIEFTSTEDFT